MMLSDQVAIVTGAGRGIGRSIATALAEQGATVAVNYHRSADAAQSLVDELTGKGHTAKAFQADVSSWAECEALIAAVTTEWTSPAIVVNNAGISKDTLMVNMTEEQCWDVMRANFGGTFNMTRLIATTMMAERYGRIINISSPAGSRAPVEGQANYSASKAAIDAFTRCSALELARFGVTVNAVAPGFVPTDLVGGLVGRYEARIRKRIPVRQFQDPDHVGRAVAFLASPDSSYITGEILHVDGGVDMSMGL